jgi:N utilization substance protein B
MARRSRSREVAFQVLYQDDLNPHSSPALGEALIDERLKADDLAAFARELVAGVRRNRQELDQRIEQTAANWSLHRMAATDRNVLRLGAYEIFHSDVPPRAAIDEAVGLAKRFGSAQSAQFVNGILDKLMRVAQGGASEPVPSPIPNP